MEHEPEADVALVELTPQELQIDELTNQLNMTRRHVAEAMSRFDTYRAAVRRTVIENIKNGTICLDGANAALESWGDDPYFPRYAVRMAIELSLTVNADNEQEARDTAREAVEVTSDDYYLQIDDISVYSVENVEE